MYKQYKYTKLTTLRWRYKKKYKKYIKFIGFLIGIFITSFLIYRLIRLNKISKLNDFVQIYKRDLNNALKNLPQIAEWKDEWKNPEVPESRIFSAYLETRPEVVEEADSNLVYNNTFWAFIRVVGIIPVKSEYDQLNCVYQYENVNKPGETYIINKLSIQSELVAKGEDFGMKYDAAFVLCSLPFPEETLSKKIELPFKITVMRENLISLNINESKFVTIKYPKKGWGDDKQPDFAVCVQPLHHKFNRTLELITFIEYYKMMGVKHFTFYRDSITPQVNNILNYYNDKNSIIVLDWKLPDIYVFEQTLRVDGIFAALNDCLYRSTFYHGIKYMIGVDVDEFIVPRKHNNLSELMKYLNVDDFHGAWIFRNTFYYLMYPDDSVTLPPDVPKLNIHYKTKRWEEFHPSHSRSKYIVEGTKIVEVGNHQMWKTRPIFSTLYQRYKESTVDTDVATSNHYRMCEVSMDECMQRKMILDRTTHRFTSKLGERVKKVFREIFMKQ